MLALVKGDAARYVHTDIPTRPAARAEHPGLVRDEKTDAAGLTHRQERALDVLGKVLGVEVRFADALTDARGRKAQARYANGVITLALDAADPFMATAVHETVHRIRELSEGDYDYLKNFVIDNMSSHYYSDDQSAKARLYGEDADLTEETVADAFGRILGDEATLRQFVRENSTTAQRFFDALNDLLDRVKAALRGESVETRTLTPEQRAVYSDLAGKLDTMLKLYGDALGNVRESEGEANGGAKFSINHYYSDIVQQWNDDGRPEGARFILGSTGPVLQGLGAIENDIFLNSDKVVEILNDHPEMSLNTIKRIPEMLEDPVLVLKSKGQGKNAHNSRVVLYSGIKAENGKPIMAALDLRPVENKMQIMDMQKVNSAYTRRNGANFIKSSEVLHADEKRTIPLLRSLGLQYRPSDLLRSGSFGSISYNGTDVNISGVPFSSVVFDRIIKSDSEEGKPKYSLSDREKLKQVGQRGATYPPAADRPDVFTAQPADSPPSLYDLAYAMYTGESDRLYRELNAMQAARGGGLMQPAPEMARDDREQMNADPRVDREEESTSELPVDYLSILDLGYGPVSASRLRDLLMMGEVETYVEDGRIRFRRAKDTK